MSADSQLTDSPRSVTDAVAGPPPTDLGAQGRLQGFRTLLRGVGATTTGRVGAGLLLLIGLIAIIGPLVAPHSTGEILGRPLESPSGDALLGTDILGRDTLSRFLSGGLILLLATFAATLLAYMVGGALGLVAGYRRGLGDLVLIGAGDVLLSIPPIILALVLVAGLGGGVGILTLAVALVQAPPVFRLVRSFTIAISGNEYVEAAVARGESAWSILTRDILPNIRVPVLADFGVRASWSLIMFASLSFLGLGQAPPAADWGLMISENRPALMSQPLPVLVPAAAVALLAIGINLAADAGARAIGKGRADG